MDAIVGGLEVSFEREPAEEKRSKICALLVAVAGVAVMLLSTAVAQIAAKPSANG